MVSLTVRMFCVNTAVSECWLKSRQVPQCSEFVKSARAKLKFKSVVLYKSIYCTCATVLVFVLFR